MAERGYLEGKSMVTVFNLLRSNDLIWPYVINNYVKGKAPFPFDLLYWNSDATRLPAANHSFYLRNCYLENKLSKGEMKFGNTPIDLRAINSSSLQPGHPRGSYRSGEVGIARLQIFRRTGEIRAVRIRPYRRRGQSAEQTKVSILDRRAAAQRQPRRLDRQGDRTSGFMVARLARLAESSGLDPSPRPNSRRRRAQTHRRCAGKLRKGAGLTACGA